MSSKLRLSRSILAALITLCVFFTCLPAGRTVKAAADPTVYYACKENVNDENVIVNTGSIPEGQHCFAVLVDNGGSQFPYTVEQFIKDSYSDTDEDNNIPVIVNNALIDAGDLSDLNFVLLGNGKAQFNGYGFFSNANNAYTGDKTDFDALESYIGKLGDLQSSYSLNVFGNMTIKEPAVFNAVYISNNCTLTVSHEGNNGHTELTVDTLNIASSGKLVIADGAEPNGLNIMKELNAPDGSITGANGSVLQIESGAVVKGGITLYAQGGTTALTGAGFSNTTYLETESYTYWTVGYDSARWIEDGEPGPEDPPGIYVAFNNEFFTSCTYKIDNGESQEVPLDGRVLTGGNADSITFTFVPEAGTLNVKQGDHNLTVTNNSFTINKTDFDWTQRPCYVEVTTARPNGIYFHYEDGLVDEINYELGESSSYTVSGNYIAPSVYEHVSGIYFHVVTVDASEEISTYISTDNGLSYGTGNFSNEFYLERSGDSWPEVYDVFIRRGEKKYPGMYLNFDRGENSPIEKIQYSLDDGALTDLTEEFLSYDIYRYNAKVKFVLTPKSGVDNLEVGIDWDQNYIGTTAPFTGFVFANNEIVITKPADAEEWGALYEIGINVPGDPVPGGTFEIRFPGAPQVVDGVQCRFGENEDWSTAAADGDDLYFNIDRNRTAVYLKLLKRENSGALSINVESKSNPGAAPVVMTGITLDDNDQFILTKPEGEGANWEGNYIVTITAEGGDNPTPTPDPQNELAKFGGYRIRLDGYVGISYYVALDQGIRDSNTKITFTFDSINPEFSRQEIGFDSARYVVEEGKGDYYVFDFKVAPNDMTKTITATLTNRDYSLTFEQFTARDYVDYYAKHGKENLAALANSIKNYGYYTQLKFGPSDPIFAGDAMTLTDPSYDRVTVGSIQDGISYSGSSVVFLSGNKIKHYFTITSNPDAYTFKVNGKTVNKVSEGGNLYSVSTEEIPASVLATGISVEVFYNGNVIKSFSYSAMNYAKAVLDSQGTTSEMKSLVKAFAMYYTAVNAYNKFGN